MSATFSPCQKEIIDGREVWCHVDSIFDVNVSNRNASLLLTELGFEVDYAGTIEVSLLLAAITMRQTFPSGIKLATIEEGNMIDIGVDEDYVPRQLSRLAELCEYCLAEGIDHIGWA